MEPRLPDPWRTWIAENLIARVDESTIASTLAGQGFPAELISEEIGRAHQHPYVAAGDRVAQRLRKLESMLQVRVELGRQNGPEVRVPAVEGLSPDGFRAEYYARNRPVKLLGMMDGWPALQRWTPGYLRAAAGDQLVEIVAGRDSDPEYELNLERHRQRVRFADFVDAVEAGTGNDAYLVANNHFFDQPGTQPLLEDVPPMPGFLTDGERAASTYLWFGAGGTVTELHHDIMNVLFCQVFGRKRVVMVAPDEAPWLYNDVSVYSRVRLEEPDLDRYPLFRHVEAVEVVVEPGEMLFIPVGWWHHVRALETSISVSFTNFVFPNQYHWWEPDIRR